MKVFQKEDLKKLYKPAWDSNGEDNGSVVIIGGSSLFHGAPFFAIKATSRIVDMVYFASPERSVGEVASRIRSHLFSFIWIPWEEVGAYIEKSDAVLIGPGLMRFSRETQNSNLKSQIHNSKTKTYDKEGEKTRKITKSLLSKFKSKKWVIDAGSLQTMDTGWIPENAILTPNKKELRLLFGIDLEDVVPKQVRDSHIAKSVRDDKADMISLPALSIVKLMAKKYNCTIVLKGPETIVVSPDDAVIVKGGNPGLTKGGTGDVLAGLTVALLAKNDPFLAACSASYIVKAAADELYKQVGANYNSDDLAEKIPHTVNNLMS